MPSFGQNHERGKADALKDLAEFLDGATSSLTDGVPTAEQLLWAPKEAASKRYLDGVASPDDLDMLRGEAEEMGETLGVLAQRVVDKSSLHRKAVSKLTGIRRKAEAQIAKANNREAAHDIVKEAKSRWDKFMGQIGG